MHGNLSGTFKFILLMPSLGFRSLWFLRFMTIWMNTKYSFEDYNENIHSIPNFLKAITITVAKYTKF